MKMRELHFKSGQTKPAVGEKFCINDIRTHEHLCCECVEVKETSIIYKIIKKRG